jgi:molybdopterin molybdotransferase
VAVCREPRVMVVSTGDELVEPGLPIADHQVRRSNAYGVSSALRLHGFRSVHDEHLRDDEALMRARLDAILAAHDVVVLSGGISKGRFDFVPAALAALGVPEVFQEVAQRPGRPMWFGLGTKGQLVFGLPGNPVATQVCLIRYVLPALLASMGCQSVPPERFATAGPMNGRKMTYFMPVTLLRGPTGASVAQPCPPRGSGDFLALAGTAGFLELPPRPEGYPAGFVADLYRW